MEQDDFCPKDPNGHRFEFAWRDQYTRDQQNDIVEDHSYCQCGKTKVEFRKLGPVYKTIIKE